MSNQKKQTSEAAVRGSPWPTSRGAWRLGGTATESGLMPMIGLDDQPVMRAVLCQV